MWANVGTGMHAMLQELGVTQHSADEVGEKPVIKEVTVGLFLEEIAFFMEDMEKDLWWLVRMAHQPDGIPPYICGDEQIQQVDAAVEAAIQRLKERADKHAEDHVAQVRAKIVIIPAVDKVEHTYQEHQQAEEALLEAKKDGIRRLAITRKMKERQT
eukprot:s605_g5.t1